MLQKSYGIPLLVRYVRTLSFKEHVHLFILATVFSEETSEHHCSYLLLEKYV